MHIQPTMEGFEWTPRVLQPRLLDGDGWCLRDAFCELFMWAPGSWEWSQFIECPAVADPDRLVAHWGLKWYDPEYPPHRAELATKLDHPAVTFHKIHSLRMSHAIFEGHARYLRGLPAQYLAYQPEYFRIVVDERQPPRW